VWFSWSNLLLSRPSIPSFLFLFRRFGLTRCIYVFLPEVVWRWNFTFPPFPPQDLSWKYALLYLSFPVINISSKWMDHVHWLIPRCCCPWHCWTPMLFSRGTQLRRFLEFERRLIPPHFFPSNFWLPNSHVSPSLSLHRSHPFICQCQYYMSLLGRIAFPPFFHMPMATSFFFPPPTLMKCFNVLIWECSFSQASQLPPEKVILPFHHLGSVFQWAGTLHKSRLTAPLKGVWSLQLKKLAIGMGFLFPRCFTSFSVLSPKYFHFLEFSSSDLWQYTISKFCQILMPFLILYAIVNSFSGSFFPNPNCWLAYLPFPAEIPRAILFDPCMFRSDWFTFPPPALLACTSVPFFFICSCWILLPAFHRLARTSAAFGCSCQWFLTDCTPRSPPPFYPSWLLP